MALALYFGGSLLVGLSGWGAILLFILGLILMALEAFVIPGFGVVGIAGLASLITSIFLAAPSSEQALTSLVLALIGTIVLVGLSIKILPTRKVWQRLILGTKLENPQAMLPLVLITAVWKGRKAKLNSFKASWSGGN